MTRKEKAMQYFLDGYNCSQCILLAFEDVYELDAKTALKIASPFGGGMGRLREVCGSVSGMFMVLGLLYGYDDAENYEGKKALYEHVQELARRYEQANGSIICRELLGLDVKRQEATPEQRTEEYYKKRSCKESVGSAAEILEQYLNELGKFHTSNV
ncbi:MAG: C_GCAxxG_C_C family protein [Lachnospiraceae bacterium]|nr:C_GCAxxG_C_C family protein [Lachnospiraceae bacterium]